MKISVEQVPHENQRYDTVGDWEFDGDDLLVNVSELYLKIRVPKASSTPVSINYDIKTVRAEDSEFLVAIHEIIEAYLCKRAGITTEQVDAWDMNFMGDGEPGGDPGAPYFEQHKKAGIIEEILCSFLGLKWENHEKIVNQEEVIR